MGLTKLREMIDDWRGEKIPLQKLKGVVLMKAKECDKTRRLLAEARNQWGSAASKRMKNAVTLRVIAPCA